MESKNILVIVIAVILCIAIAAGAYAYLNTGSDSNINDNINSVQSDDSNINLVLSDNSSNVNNTTNNTIKINDNESFQYEDYKIINNFLNMGKPSLKIVNTTISTGHTVSAKTYSTINVKAENVKNVKVNIIYSRDGSQLANEDYNVTIDNNSNIKIESIDSFKKYPDKVEIKIYTTGGKLLDSVTISLATDDSVQFAEGNGTVTAKSITEAQHSASSANYDSGAFYSAQAGRTIYTGEVQLAPDDHHWKHLGNNEWVRID